jgi:hypothetical protein
MYIRQYLEKACCSPPDHYYNCFNLRLSFYVRRPYSWVPLITVLLLRPSLFSYAPHLGATYNCLKSSSLLIARRRSSPITAFT